MNVKHLILTLNLFIFFNILSEDKKFVIVIPSYKNTQYYRKNLDSVICQKYDRSKFRVVYIDDASPWEENTTPALIVEKYIAEKNVQDLITLRKTKIRRGAMANLWSEISLCDPNEIVVMLDGDDSLKDENVLSYLNEVYSDPNVWLTYGQYECDPSEAGVGFAANYSEEIVKNRDFRKTFLATHLRTYYAWLFQCIKLEDFIYDDSFLIMTWDQAIMFPSLEMCGNKFKFISKILYKYNMNNPLSDYKTDPTLMFYLAEYFKNKPKYPQLKEPKYVSSIYGKYKNPAAVGFIYGIDKYLSPGADINDRDFKGRTPLIQAIKFGFYQLIEFLISKSADVNMADYDGLTPLMYATIFSDTSIVKYLIDKKADVHKANNFGQTAISYARKYNKGEIINLLDKPIKRSISSDIKLACEHFKKIDGKTIVEIGTNQSCKDWPTGYFSCLASEYLDNLKINNSVKIIIIDKFQDKMKSCKNITTSYKENIEYYSISPIEFVENNTKPNTINMLYLDTQDITSLKPSVYFQLDIAKAVVAKNVMSNNGIILINNIDEDQKINLAKEFFLKNGFEIMNKGVNDKFLILKKVS